MNSWTRSTHAKPKSWKCPVLFGYMIHINDMHWLFSYNFLNLGNEYQFYHTYTLKSTRTWHNFKLNNQKSRKLLKVSHLKICTIHDYSFKPLPNDYTTKIIYYRNSNPLKWRINILVLKTQWCNHLIFTSVHSDLCQPSKCPIKVITGLNLAITI